jgi:hypothetical protein
MADSMQITRASVDISNQEPEVAGASADSNSFTVTVTKKVAYALGLVVCCAMLGITLLGNEMSKDFRPTPGSGVLEDEDGNTLGVRTVEQQDGFAAAFDWKPQQLDRVKSLYFPEDPTVTCATDVCACRVHNPSRIEYLSAYCVRNPTTRGVIWSSQRHAITTRLVVLEH